MSYAVPDHSCNRLQRHRCPEFGQIYVQILDEKEGAHAFLLIRDIFKKIYLHYFKLVMKKWCRATAIGAPIALLVLLF